MPDNLSISSGNKLVTEMGESGKREPLGDSLTVLVAILATFVILVNALLSVSLVRDSRLWNLVRLDFMMKSFDQEIYA